jgi:hypothetical protein
MCSHNPSDAKIKNRSCELRTLEQIDGSDVRTGRRRGSERWKRAVDGSRANSRFFKYASPIDLETYEHRSERNKIKCDLET